MAGLDDIRQTFLVECEEQLEVLTDGLSALEGEEGDAPDPETVNAMFRAVHSIKGGAASFGLNALVRFAHAFESVLDEIRSGARAVDAEVLRVFFRAADHLADLVAAGEAAESIPEAEREARTAEVAALATAPPEEAEDLAFEPLALPIAALADPDGPLPLPLLPEIPATGHRIRFAPTPRLYANGHDPLHLFRALAELGALAVVADLGGLGEADGPDPASGPVAWDLTLDGAASAEEIAEIFDFVGDLARVEIVPTGPDATRDDPIGLPVPDASQPDPAAPRVTAAGNPAPQPEPEAMAPPAGRPKAPASATVRVKLDVVDELISMVGELVINQSVIAQAVHELPEGSSPRLDQALDDFRHLARQLQEGVMAIRAQSVKPLFQRMARIVRETADVAGKPITFHPEGEATELDRTVIERLVDPLTHIIRNAIDHGLETPERRRAAGKPEHGRVRLSAAHQSGRVVIEVSDDGGGIDRERVLEIAVARGLIAADATLEPAEIDRLLFQPGFSTAEQVTDLSGRGVGMDVVNREIRKLGGRIAIASTPGRGTTLSISLPLTLAVLEGMIVEIADQTMVVPISAIVETIRPDPAKLRRIGAEALMVDVRGRMVPVIDMAALFGWSREPNADRVLLLIQGDRDRPCALLVDAIHDQRQVVIRSLEANYGRVPGVAAATILGDGRIALIVDPEEIAQHGPGASAPGLDPMEMSA
ncbi:chemotaxis protein CheA [Jannaschia ovalis]|uniref:Chemotaxis protein CheA n=1 Tax=Jannaschia ovalis TaxID=3038773 RepID=A0ABY8LFR5_9RHOB|nr:chemotaxis protein CheA [Jannaschia sp. GRR-S6-38]WGH80142.1 chemotaxis protein CheA [Jannaschia sp. GRR-S6-38]